METILLAEDEKIQRELFGEILQENFPHYVIESFDNGGSLVNRLLNGDINEIKAVITDNTMPGYSGIEIIKKFASSPEYSHTPFILCSATSIKQLALECGAYGFVEKPFKIEDYLKTVANALLK